MKADLVVTSLPVAERPRGYRTVPLDYRPSPDLPEDQAAAELAWCLADPYWRVCSGALYWIMLKSEGEDGQSVAPFKPNRAQLQLIRTLHHRNVVVKARQLGFTTLACVMWLDHALFVADQRCGIVAHDREAAAALFRDKVKFAYDRLPEVLRLAMPLAKDSADELLFAHNNSSIRVATSMRSGTIHRLHVSELGKIAAKFPAKAAEVMTGTIPAVPLDGITVIESTAEGRTGEFFEVAQRAQAVTEAARASGKTLTPRDYRLHFFPWWDEPGYVMPDHDVPISAEDDRYFDELEAEIGQPISLERRRWYVATRDADFPGRPERMWQEYPSTIAEAFKASTAGTYYAAQIIKARQDGRITRVPHVTGTPVNTFWDIGGGDGTAVWLHQRVGLAHRFFRFVEGWDKPYSHFITELQRIGQAEGIVWGVHHLPHDAEHKRQQGERVAAPVDELREIGGIGGTWKIVPRVDRVIHGIQQVRDVFGECWFDEVGCKEGVVHLENYRKSWNARGMCWNDEPMHDVHSEAADAFRQFAQGWTDQGDVIESARDFAARRTARRR